MKKAKEISIIKMRRRTRRKTEIHGNKEEARMGKAFFIDYEQAREKRARREKKGDNRTKIAYRKVLIDEKYTMKDI